MKVHITRKHIETAVERDSHHCMIADAVKSRNDDAQYISVDLQTIKFTSKKTGERFTFLTPPKAQMNIIRFDQGKKDIEPFNFELNQAVLVRDKSRNAKSSAHQSRDILDKRAKRAKRKYTKSGNNKGKVVMRERKFGIRMYKE